MEAKRRLTTELGSVVKTALKEGQSDSADTVSSNVLTAICNVTEAVFIHGLRQEYFLKASRHSKYPEPNFWPFVAKFAHRNVRNQIRGFKQIKTEIGMGRAWLRLALNEQVLEHYVTALSRDSAMVRLFYHRYAYLRDMEQIEIMINFVKALSRLKLSAPTNSSVLNSWTPTPLCLAGLIQPDSTTFPARHLGQVPEMDEVGLGEGEEVFLGVSALDMEGFESDDAPSTSEGGASLPSASPLSPFARTVEEQSSSVYSHPSILDAKFAEIMRSLADEKRSVAGASSGLDEIQDSGIGAELPAASEVVVHRTPAALRPLSMSPVDSSSRVRHSAPTKVFAESAAQTCPSTEPQTEGSDTEQLHAGFEASTDFSVTATDDSFMTANDTGLTQSLETDENSAETADEGSSNHLASGGKREADQSEARLTPAERSFSPGNSLMGRGWSSSDLAGVGFGQTDAAGDASSLMARLDEHMSAAADASFGTLMRDALADRRLNGHEEESVAMDAPLVVEVDRDGFESAMNDGQVEIGRLTVADDGGCGRHPPPSTPKPLASPSVASGEATDDFVVVSSAEERSESGEPAAFDERVGLLSRLAAENGLDAQAFQCHTCRKPIGIAYGPFKVCSFDGCYYCDYCHRDDEAIVPARVILNWDLKPKRVSRASRAFLEHVADRPLIKMDQANPAIYAAVPAMQQALELRHQLSLVAMYLLSCKESVAEDLRKRLWPKEYLYAQLHLYCISDLVNVTTGVLQKHLRAVVTYAIAHVTDCRLCSQKGFICEICNHPQTIFPFQVDSTHRCETCFSVFHADCGKGRPCVKCARRQSFRRDRTESLSADVMNSTGLDDQ